jgi:hypothetical protein
MTYNYMTTGVSWGSNKLSPDNTEQNLAFLFLINISKNSLSPWTPLSLEFKQKKMETHIYLKQLDMQDAYQGMPIGIWKCGT